MIYALELWKPCHGSIYRRTWNVPIEKISGQQLQATVNIYHWKFSLKIDKSKLQCNKNYIEEEINHLSENCKTLHRNTKYIVEEIRQLSKNRKSQVHCQLVLSESPACGAHNRALPQAKLVHILLRTNLPPTRTRT